MSSQATAEAISAPSVPTRRSALDKHLIFCLGAEEFGIQVLFIKEIISMQEITVVPKMPAHVVGIINLRGQVIPVVDLSLKFALPPREYTPRTCIIVVRTCGVSGGRLIGAIADGVTEVLTISAADVEVSPDFGGGTAAPYLAGIAKVRGKVKLLLNVDEVFHTDLAIKPGAH